MDEKLPGKDSGYLASLCSTAPEETESRMQRPITSVSRPEHRRYRRIATVLVAAIAVIAVAGMALARSAPSLTVAKHVIVAGKAESVVAASRGLTVYTLSGETARHLKCTKANGCFAVWIPVTTTKPTSALSSAAGIRGKLGELRRHGLRQLTLAGRLLYTFVGDGGKTHRSTGEGIASFHGVWHVVATSVSRRTAPTHTTTTTSSPYPGYP